MQNCTLAPEKITDQADLGNRERSPARVFASYQPIQNNTSSMSSSSFVVNL